VDLYSVLDDKHLVLKALRPKSHSANNTMPAFSLRSRSPDGDATDCADI